MPSKKVSKYTYLIPFMLIAAILWYVNKLSAEYKAEVELPIEINYDYNSIGWVENPSMRLNCLVESKGKELVKYDVKIAAPISIQASNLSFIKQEETGYYKIQEESLKEALRLSQSKLNLLQLFDTIPWVKITPMESATLPIKNNVEVSCEKQFMIVRGIRIQPTEISVRAPKSILDTLKYISTEHVVYSKRSKSINRDISLIIPEGVMVNDKRVRLMVDITGYTELEYKLPVEARNLPERRSLLSFPSHVTVLIKVPLKSFETREELEDPTAKIDYLDGENQRSNLYKIYIENLPQGGEVTSINPEYVEPFFKIN